MDNIVYYPTICAPDDRIYIVSKSGLNDQA